MAEPNPDLDLRALRESAARAAFDRPLSDDPDEATLQAQSALDDLNASVGTSPSRARRRGRPGDADQFQVAASPEGGESVEDARRSWEEMAETDLGSYPRRPSQIIQNTRGVDFDELDIDLRSMEETSPFWAHLSPALQDAIRTSNRESRDYGAADRQRTAGKKGLQDFNSVIPPEGGE